MKMNNYPEINFEQVFIVYNICMNVKRDPSYLEDAPYSDSIKNTIKALTQKDDKTENNSTHQVDLRNLDLKAETEYLYMETKTLLNSKHLDDKEKSAIIKTATSQLEKLLDLIERAYNLKQLREFEVKVLNTLKKVLPEKREEFLKELTRVEGEDDNN